MKYCPYCGASLMGGAVSFCAECGAALPQVSEKAKHSKRPVQNNYHPQPQDFHKEDFIFDDGYDGYYDDVQPLDADSQRQNSDPELIKRIIFVIAGALLLISGSAALLLLL